MADNITINPSTGVGTAVTTATDDVAGVHFQKVKLDIGGDGLTSPVTSGNPLPVSGTFFQTTQPVSGTVSVGNFPATQAVSIATMPTTPVTGTFWPATQPVSGTVSVSGSVAVTGTFFQTTQPVSIATMPTTPVTGTFWQATQPVSVAALPALAAGSNTIGTTLGPTLTKATQGATGYSVQNLKDAGRTSFAAATAIAGVTAVTAEALVTMVPVRAGVASATVTSQAVTTGKRLRLQSMSVGYVSTAAAVLSMRFALRMNPSGAVTATSPILRIISVSQQAAALAQAGNEMTVDFPDGFEFSGAEQFGITQIGSAATGTCWVSLTGFEY